MTKLSNKLSSDRSCVVLLRRAAGLLTQFWQSNLQEAVEKKLVDTQTFTASAYDRSYVQSVAEATASLAKCVFNSALVCGRAHPSKSKQPCRQVVPGGVSKLSLAEIP